MLESGKNDTRPFVHRLRPQWGDTDPARMVYTGRYPDFALRAIDAWFLARAGADFYRLNTEWGIGTPFVRLECDFRSPLTPRDIVEIEVSVERAGEKSLTFAVRGLNAGSGRLAFEGRFVCVCVKFEDQSRQDAKSIPLDPRIRAAAEADLARQDKSKG
ncbi:MAG: acyl-CoA thioesterase [Hyphomicrobiaceae bacterium]|nr:MAG: acyl-CoA thioesterase [Hyphomicrobiaceae bacterium]